MAQLTSVLTIPKLRSASSLMVPFEVGWKKLGHPVPDSNLVSELNSGVPQTMQR